jgi:hypothetical protein
MAIVSSKDFLRASERTTAIATLNRQRHLTPSCRGFTPTAERTVGPARTCLESLDRRPGIREQYLGSSRHDLEAPTLPPLTQLYGPAVRCKPNVNKWRGLVLRICIRCMERLCSWPSWISARTRSHSEKGPERPLGSPDHGYDGETVSPFPQSNSQTSAGIFSSC